MIIHSILLFHSILLIIMFVPVSTTYAFDQGNMTDYNPITENESLPLGSDGMGQPDFSGDEVGIEQPDFGGMGNMAQPDFSANKTLPSINISDLPTSSINMSDLPTSSFEPSDIADQFCDTNDYPSTACKVVKDLISLPPGDVQYYGLSDQSGNVIQQTFHLLNPGNLTKVLQNIPPVELSMIRDKLTPRIFNETISRIPSPERDIILNKLSQN